jgi:peptide/nickel transport system substrate-binding protein
MFQLTPKEENPMKKTPKEENPMKKTTIARRRTFGVAALAGLLAISLAASPSSSAASSTKVPQNMTVAFFQDTLSLNPYGSADVQTSTRVVINQIFDNLVVLNPRTNQYVPSLATSWTQPDDLTWNFTLRKAKFHNGAPVTAKDVAADINFLAKSGTPMAPLWSSLDTAIALSTNVVSIKTKKPSCRSSLLRPPLR